MSAQPILPVKPQRPRYCPKCRVMRGWVLDLVYGYKVRACLSCGTATQAKEPKKIKARATRPRKQRKSTRGALKRKCDRLWSKVIRASNGGRCWLAGKDHVRCGGPIQGAHCFGRGHHSVRHELWNGVPLCGGHHVYYTNNPEAWTMTLLRNWGAEMFWLRERRAQTISRPDYAAIASELEGLRAWEAGIGRTLQPGECALTAEQCRMTVEVCPEHDSPGA